MYNETYQYLFLFIFIADRTSGVFVTVETTMPPGDTIPVTTAVMHSTSPEDISPSQNIPITTGEKQTLLDIII